MKSFFSESAAETPVEGRQALFRTASSGLRCPLLSLAVHSCPDPKEADNADNLAEIEHMRPLPGDAS